MVENKDLVEQKSPTMLEFLVCDPGSLLSSKTVGCYRYGHGHSSYTLPASK